MRHTHFQYRVIIATSHCRGDKKGIVIKHMIGSRHFNHALYLGCKVGLLCFRQSPGIAPRMTICMLTEFTYHADCTRTSVANCFGPLLFRLKYENAESKRQIMEPGAREQTVWFVFLFRHPSRGDLQKLKHPNFAVLWASQYNQCPWNDSFPAASCLSLSHVGQKETPFPAWRSPNTRQ